MSTTVQQMVTKQYRQKMSLYNQRLAAVAPLLERARLCEERGRVLAGGRPELRPLRIPNPER